MAKSKYDDTYDADFLSSGEIDLATYKSTIARRKEADKKAAQENVRREVGPAPPPTPEILAKREELGNDFVKMHREVFPDSTGEKPFGPAQIDSTYKDQDVFKGLSNRLLKLEPRGFTKTTRLTNEATYAALMGWQPFTVIVASSLEKSIDILAAIKTELVSNPVLADLFPGPCAAFAHLRERGQNALLQTYGGEPTYIKFSADTIHFPVIPGEPSSGAIIKVRPLGNLKGINYKVRSGPNKGKVYRPTLYIFDDPQTEDDAESVSSVRRIIKNIKRSALKGGSHSRPVAAIMAITPVFYGDVAWHFEKNEESWQLVRYKMVEKFPKAHDRWMTEYAEIRSRYDREIRGSRDKALRRAAQWVMENYDELHEGHEVAWEYAYSPGPPEHEVSAIQHAYNIILDDGMEDFEFEYQCNTEYGMTNENVTIHAPVERIVSKQLPLPRKVCPQETRKIVTHIDVNMDILTYVTMASGNPIRPHIIDYGTYPKQHGKWSKKVRVGIPLRTTYSNPDYREVLYLATLDLIEFISQQNYKREDGIELTNNVIGIDVRYEEQFITRAIRESIFRNMVVPCWGIYVGPDEDSLHQRNYPAGVAIHDNCVEVPSKDGTLVYLNFDANFMKTELHKGFNLDQGVKGSVTLFQEEFPGQHTIFADHLNSEHPKRVPGKKTNRTRIQWYEKKQQPDNEFMDNASCCLALLRREGLQAEHEVVMLTDTSADNNIQDYVSTTQNLLDY